MRVLPFQEMRDPDTGRTRVRLVDVGSEHFKVAQKYMIRLGPQDLGNHDMRAKLAEAAGMTPELFERKFASAVGVAY